MFSVSGLSFHLYGLIIGLGIIAALQASQWFAKKKNISSSSVESGFWVVVISGIFGARLYHVVDLWGSYYSKYPLDIFAIWKGGLGIWGAILGGLIGFLFFYFSRQKSQQNFLLYMDIASIGVPLGQAIGRWGNYFNQELLGTPTTLPWGILNSSGIRVHPLFLYESVLNFSLFILLIKTAQTQSKTGIVSAFYLIGYGFIRLILESFRPYDTVWKISGVPTAQIVSIIAIIFGVILLFYIKKSPALAGDKN